MQQIVTKKDLVPDADGIRYQGTATLKFNNVYANAFVGIVVTPYDASLKTDIVQAARSGLEDIDALPVVDFTWKADAKHDTDLIAQQAREVNPALYHEGVDMIGHIAQYPLLVALVKYVQELSERIQVLEGRRGCSNVPMFHSSAQISLGLP